jgi:hypothetical protein
MSFTFLTRSRPLTAALLVTACLALVLGGCGGSDDDEPQGSAGTTNQPSDNSTNEDSGKNGGSGGEGNDDRGGGGDGDDGAPAFTGDVEEAREGAGAVDEIYEGFGAAVDAGAAATDVPAGNTLEAAEDNESLTEVCDLMSEQAKRQTIVYAKRSAGLADVEWTCEKATALLLRRARQSGGLERSLRAEIVGVNVEGDRATASVRFGGKGPISSVPLVKEDGEWKLAGSPPGGGGK